MAAPTTQTRLLPTGYRLDDGYQTLIAFSELPTLDIWEKDVQPPGIDGGDAIETTTQHNADYRTMAPRQLLTMTEHTITAAYDPGAYSELFSLINVSQMITVIFPDGSTLDYYGYIKGVEFSPLVEGEQPEMTITVVPTNYDCDNCVEAGPVMTSNGTCSC